MKRLLNYHRRLALHGPRDLAATGVFLLLLPASLLYGAIGWLRCRGYEIGLFPSYRASVPVVSVGNIAAGGTGKTPVVDWLTKLFIGQGKKVAIVSRGYGGTFSGPVGVVSEGTGLLLEAAEAGDESCLLALRNSEAIVLIARKRSAGVRVAVERYAADVVILDDGFQHRAVRRDLDLVLLDAQRPFGNGLPLPAGILREFPSALRRADLLLLTRAGQQTVFPGPAYKSQHLLADNAVNLNGKRVALNQLKGLKLFAFAGIADPDAFFSGLEAKGVCLTGRLALGDHCNYDQSLLSEIAKGSHGCDALITTEKDAVKLKGDFFELPCYQAPMDIQIEDESSFIAEIQQKLWS